MDPAYGSRDEADWQLSACRPDPSSLTQQQVISGAIALYEKCAFRQTNGNVQGTISYPCHIPALSTAGRVAVSDSVSQAGARRQRDVMAGYRRGGVRAVSRRDSLSDSDA